MAHRRTRAGGLAGLLATAALLVTGQDGERAGPPSSSETKELVERAFAVDRFEPEGAAELRAIRARLDLGRPLSSSAARTWRKKLLERAEERPTIRDDYGPGWFYERPDGLYTVRGRTNRPTGLLVRLHGSTLLTEDNLGANETFVKEAAERDWVVVQPARRTESISWTDPESERFVVELVEAALRTFDVDPNRVFVAGNSAGGMGAWDLGARHADRFAWICSVAGCPSPPLRRDGVADGLTPNLRNTFVLCFHSKGDPRVRFAWLEAGLEKLAAAAERWGGYAHEFVEDPRPHAHGAPAEGMGVLYDRVRDVERDPRPEKLVWQPTLEWKRQFAWLAWDAPVVGTLVVAELDREANAVHVTTEGDATGLEVLLDDDLLDLDREVVVTLNGQEVHRGEPERRLSVLLATALRGDPHLVFEASVPVAPAR